MKVEAQRGLDWREEHGRGGTRVGAVRARQIVAGEFANLRVANTRQSVWAPKKNNKQER